MTKSNDQLPLCYAPWHHTFVGPTGERSLCCHSKRFSENHNVNSEDFESFWYGEEMTRVRNLMLAGKLPQEYCQSCIKSTGFSEAPYHQYQISPSTWEQITENGALSPAKPIYLDYRLGNLCNLSCRTCSGKYSSKIEKIANQISPPKEDKQTIENLKHDEFENLLENPKIEKLYFAHGEPVLQKEHWAMLSKISQDEERSKKITLEYNSNLNHEVFFKEENRQILGRFKEVLIGVSIDSAGETGEFIRDGLTWNRFVKNIRTLRTDSLYTLTSLDITFTLPLLLDVKGLALFLIEQKIAYTVRMIIPGGYSTVLSPHILPKTTQQELYRKALEDLHSVDKKGVLTEFEAFLKNNLSDNSIDPLLPSMVANELRYSVDFDQRMNRENVLSFYANYPIVDSFLRNVSDKEQDKESTQKESLEKSFWIDTLTQNNFPTPYLIFPTTNEIEKELEESDQAFSILTSYPGLLARILNRKRPQHFNCYDWIKSHNDQIINEKKLSLFYYLGFKHNYLGPIFRFFAPLFAILMPALNGHVIITIKN